MRIALGALAVLALLGTTAPAFAGTIDIDFDALDHGELVDSDFVGQGLTISATNVGGGPNLAVAFDSDESSTRDSDLEFGTAWAGGNIQNEALGNLLIIQENSDGIGDDIADNPDDEGSRPAGSITFDFGQLRLNSLALSLVDFERVNFDENASPSGEKSWIEFFDSSGSSLDTIMFSAFKSGGTYDNGAVFGNRFANRIDPFSIGQEFSKFTVNYGGSGAIGDLSVQVVPLPPAGWMGLGLLGLLGIGRLRRRRSL